MIRRPPSSTLIDPLFPYPPLFRFELGMFGGDVDVAAAALEAGEVPFLALPAIAAPPHLVGEVGRQVVGQPAAAFGDHRGLVRRDADLLAHFTDHFGQPVLAGIDATLRHLPGFRSLVDRWSERR